MVKYSDAELVLNKDGSVYHLNLKPKNVADKIIVVGDPGRVYRVSRHFDDIEFEMNKREFITHTGTFKGKRITVLSTGMGVDNIEIAMTELDALFNIDLKTRQPRDEQKSFDIVRIGTSGAIQEDINVGTPLLSAYGVGLDNLLFYYVFGQDDFEKEIGEHLQALLNLPYPPYIVRCSDSLKEQLGEGFSEGNTVTSPGFYAPQGRQFRMKVRDPKFLDRIMYFNHKNFWLSNFEMETSALYAFARILGHRALSINAVLGNRAKGTFSKNPYKPIDAIISKVLERI